MSWQVPVLDTSSAAQEQHVITTEVVDENLFVVRATDGRSGRRFQAHIDAKRSGIITGGLLSLSELLGLIQNRFDVTSAQSPAKVRRALERYASQQLSLSAVAAGADADASGRPKPDARHALPLSTQSPRNTPQFQRQQPMGISVDKYMRIRIPWRASVAGVLLPAAAVAVQRGSGNGDDPSSSSLAVESPVALNFDVFLFEEKAAPGSPSSSSAVAAAATSPSFASDIIRRLDRIRARAASPPPLPTPHRGDGGGAEAGATDNEYDSEDGDDGDGDGDGYEHYDVETKQPQPQLFDSFMSTPPASPQSRRRDGASLPRSRRGSSSPSLSPRARGGAKRRGAPSVATIAGIVSAKRLGRGALLGLRAQIADTRGRWTSMPIKSQLDSRKYIRWSGEQVVEGMELFSRVFHDEEIVFLQSAVYEVLLTARAPADAAALLQLELHLDGNRAKEAPATSPRFGHSPTSPAAADALWAGLSTPPRAKKTLLSAVGAATAQALGRGSSRKTTTPMSGSAATTVTRRRRAGNSTTGRKSTAHNGTRTVDHATGGGGGDSGDDDEADAGAVVEVSRKFLVPAARGQSIAARVVPAPGHEQGVEEVYCYCVKHHHRKKCFRRCTACRDKGPEIVLHRTTMSATEARKATGRPFWDGPVLHLGKATPAEAVAVQAAAAGGGGGVSARFSARHRGTQQRAGARTRMGARGARAIVLTLQIRHHGFENCI